MFSPPSDHRYFLKFLEMGRGLANLQENVYILSKFDQDFFYFHKQCWEILILDSDFYLFVIGFLSNLLDLFK